jgi:hypothetical protein
MFTLKNSAGNQVSSSTETTHQNIVRTRPIEVCDRLTGIPHRGTLPVTRIDGLASCIPGASTIANPI